MNPIEWVGSWKKASRCKLGRGANDILAFAYGDTRTSVFLLEQENVFIVIIATVIDFG